MTAPERTQRHVLGTLLRMGSSTAYGRMHRFPNAADPAAYAAQAPLISYADLEPWVERVKNGQADVLWPGMVSRFAVSAGTTGRGKHLPITDQRLKSDVRFMRKVSVRILRDFPHPGLFLGRHAALSGSVEQVGALEMGEISGMLACSTPWWMRSLHCLCPSRSASLPWEQRFEKLIQKSMHADLRVVSGVPSWLLLFFKEVSRRRGRPVPEIWPHLKLIVTGGVALSGYMPAFRTMLDTGKVRFLENYGASEGYYAFGWEREGNMALQIDNGLYYEFIPYTGPHAPPDSRHAVPVWQASVGVPYNLVVTNNAGLWRYVTNDVVTFDSVDPPRLRITGRANEMTDTFGEALTGIEARHAFSSARYAPPPDTLHVRPHWDSEEGLPRHAWLLVYQRQSVPPFGDPRTLQDVAGRIDAELCRINRHYAVRRQTGALLPPVVRHVGAEEYGKLLAALPRSQSKLGTFI